MSEELKNLDYESQYDLPKGAFRISPSKAYNFTSKKHEWYRSEVLGERSVVVTTSTLLGICVHRVAEEFIKEGKVDLDEIYAYIDLHKDLVEEFDLDLDYIKSQVKPMGQTLINYLLTQPEVDKSEFVVTSEINKDIFVQGTIDCLIGDNLIDFKTTSSKTLPDTIPTPYRIQALIYAYALRKMGFSVERFSIVYISTNEVNRISEKTGKKLKDYPSEVKVLSELITDESMQFIEDYLKLIADSVITSKENPELTYLIFGDYRLKL